MFFIFLFSIFNSYIRYTGCECVCQSECVSLRWTVNEDGFYGHIERWRRFMTSGQRSMYSCQLYPITSNTNKWTSAESWRCTSTTTKLLIFCSSQWICNLYSEEIRARAIDWCRCTTDSFFIVQMSLNPTLFARRGTLTQFYKPTVYQYFAFSSFFM